MFVGWQPNFKGLLNSLQVIFGWVTRTPGPLGSGTDPEKGGFCHIYLLPEFWGWGVMLHLFGIGTTRANKMLGAEFWFLAHGPRKRGWEAGLAGGRSKFWNLTCFTKGPPLKSGTGRILFYANFWSDAPLGLHGYPRPGSQEVKNQKSKLGYFLQKGPPSEIKF